MSINNIDKQIANKLKDRTLEPSMSAWERLSFQLEEQESKPKRNWFLYVGYVAGIVLLFSVGFSYFGKTNSEAPLETITSIDTLQFDSSKLKELIPEIEEAVVKLGSKERKEKRTEVKVDKKEPRVIIANKVKKSFNNNKITIASNTILKDKISISIKDNSAKLNEIVIVKVDKTEQRIITQKKSKSSRITINSDNLLYAVTHASNQLKAYYVNYNVKREDVLKTIKYELKKSNLKVNPNMILAEVERGIDDDLFQNNFIQKLKFKISDIAVALVDRNK